MKLATLHDGSRDGQLVVVSRDLASAHYATGIANRLQQVLDDWGFYAPQLQDLYDALNAGRARHPFPFDPQQCMAPLPRAFQCMEAAPPWPGGEGEAQAAPVLQQLAGDALAGACQPLPVSTVGSDLDFGAGLAVVTGDLPARSASGQGLDAVRLLMLSNSVALRDLEAAEHEAGQGVQHSRPATTFSPVAVTLDELGTAWSHGRLRLTLQSGLNGRKLGLCDAAAGMPWSFWRADRPRGAHAGAGRRQHRLQWPPAGRGGGGGQSRRGCVQRLRQFAGAPQLGVAARRPGEQQLFAAGRPDPHRPQRTRWPQPVRRH